MVRSRLDGGEPLTSMTSQPASIEVQDRTFNPASTWPSACPEGGLTLAGPQQSKPTQAMKRNGKETTMDPAWVREEEATRTMSRG